MMITIHDLTTQELLSALERARNCHYTDEDEEETVFVGSRFESGGQKVEVWAAPPEIRTALVGREHVPSKKEAQVIRQLKAKTKQSEEWLRAHPKYGQEIADASSPDRRVVSAQRYQNMVKMYGENHISRHYKIGE